MQKGGHDPMTDIVRNFYAGFGEREWGRLERPDDGQLEFAITTTMLTRHLPARARVLDNGGGPGRYSLWLAERGYRVSLADLSPELLAIGRAHIAASPVAEQIEEVVEADARDPSRWSDASVGAVLALGPFYRLTASVGRDAAAREIARVLAPGGIAFIALMPRLVFLRRVLATPAERHLLGQPGFVDRVLDDGVFLNDRPGAFTEGYGVRPEEVAPYFARFALQPIALLAAQGFAPDLQGALATLAVEDHAAHRAALDALLRTAADPAILGMTNHLLYIARRA